MWASKYVGIPFEDKDCWQLCRYVYRQELGQSLPTFDYSDPTDFKSLNVIFNEELDGRTRFKQVEDHMEEDYDLVLMRLAVLPTHVGILVGERHILHTLPDIGSCIDRKDSVRLSANIRGYYRYAV